jgi:Protein of unknown function (DUF1570)
MAIALSRRMAFTAALATAAIVNAPTSAKPRPPALANIAANESADAAAESRPAERITFIDDGKQETIAGRILIEAQDGGVLLESPDGAQYTIEGKTVLARAKSDAPFRPLTPDELGEQLLAEFPPGFRVHTTPHYVICYDTSREYAEWTSSLFERLYKAFTSYWKRQGMELHEPEFPLVVIAYADRASYEAAAKDVLGPGAGNIVGYYNLKTNRVNMYDLTGMESLHGGGNRRGSMREIAQMLSQRAAVPLVSTVVHEATHQIAFNCGLQTRLSDIPLWLCEGMAVYFEAPDLSSSRGWRGIGRVNYPRLETFRRNLPKWRSDSLATLVADNRRFRDPQTAVAAYADAWALNYYLIKFRSKDYSNYLKLLAEKRSLMEDDPQTRLEEFKQHFGDLRTLEREFLKQMSRVN